MMRSILTLKVAFSIIGFALGNFMLAALLWALPGFTVFVLSAGLVFPIAFTILGYKIGTRTTTFDGENT
jgi:hypothetical protein